VKMISFLFFLGKISAQFLFLTHLFYIVLTFLFTIWWRRRMLYPFTADII
jgi:hypothetical protein